MENQLKSLENDIKEFKNFGNKGFDKDFKSFIEPFDKKLEFLSATVKKYLSVQKVLHKKLDSMASVLKVSDKKEKKGILKSRSRSNKSKTSNKGDSSYSPTLNSSRVSFGNPTPRRQGKPASFQKSRIDILYDELTNMFT